MGTEVVNVVKPYSATISDAFKVKETPPLDDEDNAPKQQIQYNIFSFPVASTFTPSKGKAASVDKTKKEKLYNNYATLGFGNYATAIGELFITENFNRNEYVGGMFRHHSSQGGIKNVDLDDKFYNTSVDLTYGNHNRDISWNANLGYQHQIYNWYGLPEYYNEVLNEEDKKELLNSIDPQQTYHNFYLGGKFKLEDSFFKGGEINYNRFWDAYSSAENRFILKPAFEVEISDFIINTQAIVDYVNGSYKNSYDGSGSYDYGFTNFGIQPSFVYNQEDLTLNIGAGLFYSLASEGKNKFFVYPQITASYKLVGDLMIFYAGAEGTLQQNSYRDFTEANPFLSPTLWIAPTDRQYDIYAGLKGKLAGNISYNVRGSYMNERGKALFKSNFVNSFILSENIPNFSFGNSFQTIYDDVKTLSIYGEVKADLNQDFSAGVNGTFFSYSTDSEEAWNLPAYTFGVTLDVNITPKWFAGTNIFFTGERKDQLITPSELVADTFDYSTISLKSYLDANAHVGYKHNERLTGFLRLNNISNQKYERWFNFPAQGFQIILGANYKFDF
ncbi:MAG: TonB-dependent receptor [Flavobacteriaceae bacterium]|nr:TonB-dependent receptor [Flavobacteriaceae bacterium]